MTIYDFKVTTNQGNEISLETYKGKVLLVVNTATGCGLTPQYEGLQALYDNYKNNGFEILDFPSNQFLEQAPGTDDEIHDFCTLTYHTTFPRFIKTDVNGENSHPLYEYLKSKKAIAVSDEGSIAFENQVKQFTPNNKDSDIKWNFEKFLIGKDGNIVERFSPVYPMIEIENKIKELL